MEKDIRIDTNNIKFKYRVSGALIENNKLLIVQIMNNGFYCLPGGHVRLGELSNIAVSREFSEEVNTPVSIVGPIVLIENIFINKDGITVHEIGITYLLKKSSQLLIPFKDYEIIEDDNGLKKKLEFKWIDLDKLDELDFRPSILKEQLKNRDFSFKNYMTSFVK